MVKAKLLKIESQMVFSQTRAKDAETLDQKGGMFAPMTWLSNLSGMPFVRGKTGTDG
jgi:hypothetical protein